MMKPIMQDCVSLRHAQFSSALAEVYRDARDAGATRAGTQMSLILRDDGRTTLTDHRSTRIKIRSITSTGGRPR